MTLLNKPSTWAALLAIIFLSACADSKEESKRQKPSKAVAPKEAVGLAVTETPIDTSEEVWDILVTPVAGGYNNSEGAAEMDDLLEDFADSCKSLTRLKTKGAKHKGLNLIGIWLEKDVRKLRDSLKVDVVLTSRIEGGSVPVGQASYAYELKCFYNEFYMSIHKKEGLESYQAVVNDLKQQRLKVLQSLEQEVGIRCR